MAKYIIKNDTNYRFLKKVASNFANLDIQLIKEAAEEDYNSLPPSAFIDPETMLYPVDSKAKAYTSYVYAKAVNDEKNAEKIACILKDIYDTEPPAYIPKTSTRVNQVKTASEYVEFLPREEKYMHKLANMVDYGFGSSEKLKELLNLRYTAYSMNNDNPNENVKVAYDKMVDIVKEYERADKPMTRAELVKIASTIEKIDTDIGIDKYYGKYIMDPVDLVNSIITNKPETVKIGSATYTASDVSSIDPRIFYGILPDESINSFISKEGSINFSKFKEFYKNASRTEKSKVEKIIKLLKK